MAGKAKAGDIVPNTKKFRCEFMFVGWSEISLGVNMSLTSPNIEFHVPFGFFSIGWYGIMITARVANALNSGEFSWGELQHGG